MNSKYPLVYIAGRLDGNVMALFYDMGFRGTNDLMLADLCVFTGGEDVSPSKYGEKPIRECGRPNLQRDDYEAGVYQNCLEFKVPMVGICRGAQMLNVLNGGTLWQHVDNHGTSHSVRDLITGDTYFATSTHHQMMRPAHNGEVIAVAHPTAKPVTFKTDSICTVRLADGITQLPGADDSDPEVVWYEETQSLCVQFHPEYLKAADGCRPHFIRYINEFLPELQHKDAA